MLQPLGLKRMFLHAHSCSFAWSNGNAELSFSAPLPPALHAVLDALTPKRRERSAS